ncbi:MAG: response regulator [Fimbriimonas sp.]
MRIGSIGHDSKLVLLIEDNEDDERLMRMALRRQNIINEIVVAYDGQEALDYLDGDGAHTGRDTSVLPMVIFVDLKIPKVSGVEVIRRLRANPKTRRIPVIVLTGMSDPESIAECYEAGANSYVVKPTDAGDFSDMVLQLGMYWLLLNRPSPDRVTA